jgi:addiction module RelE/StbE family toxin
MRVRWLRTARLNLDSIYAYIAQGNAQAARRVIQQIVERVDDLAANPNLDTSRPGRVAGTRELVIPPSYVIPFRVKGGGLQAIRVFHTRQRLPDKLP